MGRKSTGTGAGQEEEDLMTPTRLVQRVTQRGQRSEQHILEVQKVMAMRYIQCNFLKAKMMPLQLFPATIFSEIVRNNGEKSLITLLFFDYCVITNSFQPSRWINHWYVNTFQSSTDFVSL